MKTRNTYDICGDCWADVEPDQYFPEATRYGECAVCYSQALVVRHGKRIVCTGMRGVMYVNRYGEPEDVTVLALHWDDDPNLSYADVLTYEHKTVRVCPEDIGIGVDDTILGIFDNGETI
jgi:hypothetical protein